MPTYAYHCTSCTYEEDVEQKITADPLKSCPQCGQASLMRGPGGGLGLVFKGSGFYCTDYTDYTARATEQKENGKEEKKETGCQHVNCGCSPSKNPKPPS